MDELFCRALLLHLLDLPVVYHCKSSIDRTSIFVALHVALKQWCALGLPIGDNPTDLLKDPRFKEFFAFRKALIDRWPGVFVPQLPEKSIVVTYTIIN